MAWIVFLVFAWVPFNLYSQQPSTLMTPDGPAKNLLDFNSASKDCDISSDPGAAFKVKISLPQAEVLALENNYNIQSAYHLSEEGYYNYLVSIGRWLPQIDADASIFRKPIGAGLGYGTFTTSTIAFLQVVFDTDVFFNIQSRRIDMFTLREELLKEMVDVLFDTRVFYYQIVAAEDLVETEKANVELLKEQYEMYKAKFEIGEGIKYDVSASEAATLDALRDLYVAENALVHARNNFLAQMSFPPTVDFSVSDTDIDVEHIPAIVGRVDFNELRLANNYLFEPAAIDWIEQTSFRYRPEIELSRLNLSFNRTQYRRAWSKYAPSVSVFADVNNNGGRSSPPKSFTVVGVNANWVLFDGFSRENNIKGTKEVVLSSANLLQQAFLEARKDIYNLIEDLKTALQTYLSSKKGVQVAGEAVEIAKERALAGDITPLDYRNSVFMLRDARQQLIGAELGVMTAYFGLVRSIGLDISHLKRPCFSDCGFSCFDFSL